MVRRAGEGEEVETLDGERRRLDPDVVVIDDADGPTSIAGIMGGARSEVGEGTTRVLMEAATWNGPNIHRSSLRLGLRSEASARFEKQLQPEFAMQAQAVAARLMVELCGATLVPGTVDVGGAGPAPATIHLREERVSGLLGAPIARERQREILESLEFGVAEAGDGLDTTVPPHRRADVTREADLIEEVARINGVDRLPATLPARQDAGGALTSEQNARRRAEDALTAHGLLEVMGGASSPPRWPTACASRPTIRGAGSCACANPLSEEQSVMRTLLLGSLLEVAAYNAARDVADLRLFETGGVYLADGEGALPDEQRHVGVVLTGAARPRSWRTPEPPPADFFAAKGVLAALLDTLRLQWSVAEAPQPFLHPGRSAAVHVEGEALGWLGEVHPLVTRAWDLGRAAAFELDLDRMAELAGARVETYEDVTSFPAVRQDIAVVVADDVPAERVRQIVREAGGDLLRRAEVFDVYRGEQVGEGRVSLALALEFRAPDRTLTDDEVAERRAAIADALKREAGGELRA